MDTLFLLLFFVSFIALIVGLVKPTAFSRFIKGEITRKNIATIFGIATIVSLVLFGITTDSSKNNRVTQQPATENTQVATESENHSLTLVNVAENQDHAKTEKREADPPAPPQGLVLPFDLSDFGGGNDFMSPFGLVRSTKDQAEFGHGGIDIPLERDDSIFAVADGTIIRDEFAADNRGGNNVILLLQDGPRPEEGWVFLYEHIFLDESLRVGDAVRRGQRIGRSAIVSHGNNHLELAYIFNNNQYFRSKRCWVDNLAPEERASFLAVFNEYRLTRNFYDGWYSAEEEGRRPYRGLLDEGKFPEGPQLCYEPGTDAR